MNTKPQSRNLRFFVAFILFAAVVALAVTQTPTYPSSSSATPPPTPTPAPSTPTPSTPTPSYSGSSSYYTPTPYPTQTPSPSPTTYLPSGPAASMVYPGNANFQVPLERAGHTFDFRYYTTGSNIRYSSGSYVMGIAMGAEVVGGPQKQLYLAVAAFSPVSPFNSAGMPGITDWWLVDTTTNQDAPHQMLGLAKLTNATWAAASGVNNRYYAIPASRSGHDFIAGSDASGWSPLIKGQTLSSYTTNLNGTVTPSPGLRRGGRRPRAAMPWRT